MSSLTVTRSAAPVRDEVVRAIRGAIMDGTLPPGGRLKEKDLCDLTGVSRTPVREAVRVLEAQGLVVNIPGEGPRVAVLSEDEARQLYALRAVLEPFAAREFAANATDEDISRLAATVAMMRASLTTGDNAAATQAVEDFYDLLLTGGGTPLLKEVVAPLHARAGLLRQVSLQQTGRREASLRELERIVHGLEQRDADAAAKASESHAVNAASSALGVLRDAQAPRSTPTTEPPVASVSPGARRSGTGRR